MARLKFILRYILSFLPETLPVGLTEFERWADEVHMLSGLPIDQNSAHASLANMVLHIGPRKSDQRPTDRLSKQWFVHALRKGAANQVASYVFHTIKEAQQEKLKKEGAPNLKEDLAQQAGVATAPPEAVNGPPNIQKTSG